MGRHNRYQMLSSLLNDHGDGYQLTVVRDRNQLRDELVTFLNEVELKLAVGEAERIVVEFFGRHEV